MKEKEREVRKSCDEKRKVTLSRRATTTTKKNKKESAAAHLGGLGLKGFAGLVGLSDLVAL